jgi:hypothetical protein
LRNKTSLTLKLINKLLSLYVLLRHGKIERQYRYFYRDTYYCKLLQLKFLVKDYFIKRSYKTISFSGEFAPELQFVLPFAYWHYKNGTLKSTISASYTKEFYFFSPNHQEVFNERTNEGNYNFDTPRILYSHDYDMKKWARVPLKKTYSNNIYRYGKPILIIANRYNMEWGGPPISYFGIPEIEFIIQNLRDHYTIIYNRPRSQNIIMDNSEIYDLNEYEWLEQKYPEVLLMEKMFQENKAGANNFNHFQLLVYANADHFISIHGGTAALASYFGGINLIFSKQGPEHHFGCYRKLYPKLSGATIYHAKTEEQLKNYVLKYFVKDNKVIKNQYNTVTTL